MNNVVSFPGEELLDLQDDGLSQEGNFTLAAC
jgi:hypothetical protein